MKQKEYDLNEDFKCAVCGGPITGDDYDDPQDSQCPECENHLCRGCADWENINGVTMCMDCYEYYTEADDDGRD